MIANQMGRPINKLCKLNLRGWTAMRIIVQLVVIFCCLATQALSTEKIRSTTVDPFGSYSWSDGLLDVVMKTQALDGAEKMELCIKDSCTAIGSIKTMDELSVKLTALIKKDNAFFLNPNDPRVNSNLANFTDASGARKIYPETQAYFYVRAKSILIAGIPFDIGIDMELAPGLAVNTFEKVAYSAGKLYYYPLVLNSVSFYSRSPILNSRHIEIRKLLDSKYGIYTEVNFEHPEATANMFRADFLTANLIRGAVFGTSGGVLRVQCEPTDCSLVYAENPTLAGLRLKYTQHLSALEQRTLKGKKDMGNSL